MIENNFNREENASFRDHHFSLSNMDTSMMREGFQYSLNAMKVRGKSLSHDIATAFKFGWRPVERKDHPEWGMPDELQALLREGELQYQNTYIIDRDRLLMMIPNNRYKELLDMYNYNAQDQYRRIARGQAFENDPQGMYQRTHSTLARDNDARHAHYTAGHALNINAEFRPGHVPNIFGS